MLEVIATSLATDKFKDALLKCFTEVGLVEQNDETLVRLSYNKKGFLTKHIPQALTKDAVSVSDIACELALTTRPANAMTTPRPSQDLTRAQTLRASSRGAWYRYVARESLLLFSTTQYF